MKILDITANPFSRHLNNGKTHEAIFSALSKDELCQLYVRPVAQELIDFDFCSSYYCVSDWDVLNKLAFRSKSCGGEIHHHTALTADTSFNYASKSVKKFGDKKGLAGILRDILWSTNVWRNSALKSWLLEQAPDIIFVDGGGDCYIYDIALFVSDLLSIPMVYYVTDDYVIYPIDKTVLQKIHHRTVSNKISEVISKSIYRYAIGEYMAGEYRNHFKCDFDYVMNAIDVLPYSNIPAKSSDIIVSYFGSLGLNRDKSIARLGALSKGLFSIHVYSFNISDEQRQLFLGSGVEYMGSLKSEGLSAAMYNSDVLLHVESDDDESRAFTKLAVSTKIPEYLMHSRMILGYGPAEVASMKILSDNNIGLVIGSDESTEEIIKKLKEILNFNTRKRLSLSGYEYATMHFDREKIGEKIKDNFHRLLPQK